MRNRGGRARRAHHVYKMRTGNEKTSLQVEACTLRFAPFVARLHIKTLECPERAQKRFPQTRHASQVLDHNNHHR